MNFCPDCGNRNVKLQSVAPTGNYYKCWRCETIFLVKNSVDVEFSDFENEYEEFYDEEKLSDEDD